MNSSKYYKWGVRQVAFLKRNFGKRTYKELAKELDIPPSKVLNKLTTLGLKKREHAIKHYWTEKEISFLRKYYIKMNNFQLSKELRLPKDIVTDKVCKMKLTRPERVRIEWKRSVASRPGNKFLLGGTPIGTKRKTLKKTCEECGSSFNAIYKDPFQMKCKKCVRRRIMKKYDISDKRKLIRKRYSQSYKGAYRILKTNAKKRGYKVEITQEQFKDFFMEPCAYCGSPSTGLDRVDNQLHYFLGNIVPACEVCNKMKNTMSVDKWLDHMKKILGYKRT